MLCVHVLLCVAVCVCVCVCVGVSVPYPRDIHELDGCQLSCLDMATLERVREIERGGEQIQVILGNLGKVS